MPRVSVHLVTWNSRKVLADALDSLRAQNFRDFTLTVIDNASNDGSVDCVREHYPDATVIRNFKNLGFSRAHNQAIEMARARWSTEDKQGKTAMNRYVLLMNPDIILDPDCLARLVEGMDGRSETGSACGKLLKVYPRLDDNEEPRYSDVIDSIGITRIFSPTKKTSTWLGGCASSAGSRPTCRAHWPIITAAPVRTRMPARTRGSKDASAARSS